MIEDGCLDGVDRVFGMHVWPSLETGKIGVHVGPTLAQPDVFTIRITGDGGHAAAPHKTNDPLIAAAHTVTALQTAVSRNLDPLESGVVTVTQIHGGTAYNVIPESVVITGTVRSFTKDSGELLRTRVRSITESVASAFQTSADVDFTIGYPVVMNDADACDEAEAAIHEAVPITRDVAPSLGGEDFAYYQQQVPGAFLFLGNYDESQDIVYFCHHPRFRVDDNAMVHGVRAWVELVCNARSS